MNIYCELLIDRIRVLIDDEEIAFQVTDGFYANKMLAKSGLSSRIQGYVTYHQSDMNVFQRIAHKFSRNSIYVLVNQDVQQHVTLRQIHEFAARRMFGGTMYIIPKPLNFDSTRLESIAALQQSNIKDKNRDTVLAQLTSISGPMERRPAFK